MYAICAGIFHSGFSVLNLGGQLIEIAIFVPLVLFGLSRLGAYFLKRLEKDEDAYFILMLGIMAVAGLLAQLINLPGSSEHSWLVSRLMPRSATSLQRASWSSLRILFSFQFSSS